MEQFGNLPVELNLEELQYRRKVAARLAEEVRAKYAHLQPPFSELEARYAVLTLERSVLILLEPSQLAAFDRGMYFAVVQKIVNGELTAEQQVRVVMLFNFAYNLGRIAIHDDQSSNPELVRVSDRNFCAWLDLIAHILVGGVQVTEMEAVAFAADVTVTTARLALEVSQGK